MPKFFVKDEQINDNIITIIGEDVKHIKNVLRLKADDNIQICNLKTSKNYTCGISKINNDNIKCVIFNEIDSDCESKIKISILQGLPKADKMELIIQKSVELGAYEITPTEMKRCVVRFDEKSKIKKIERWQKISEAAAKQSGRDIVPKINNIINVKNICNLFRNYDIVFLAYENEQNNTLKDELLKIKSKEINKINIGIIIGPEGGIDKEEVEVLKNSGAKVITLGKRILRTETASLVLLSNILYELEE